MRLSHTEPVICAAYNRRPYKKLTAALTVFAGDIFNAYPIRCNAP